MSNWNLAIVLVFLFIWIPQYVEWVLQGEKTCGCLVHNISTFHKIHCLYHCNKQIPSRLCKMGCCVSSSHFVVSFLDYVTTDWILSNILFWNWNSCKHYTLLNTLDNWYYLPHNSSTMHSLTQIRLLTFAKHRSYSMFIHSIRSNPNITYPFTVAHNTYHIQNLFLEWYFSHPTLLIL